MRGILVMAMFVASLTGATWNKFNAERELTVHTPATYAFDFEEHFANNSYRHIESAVAEPAQVMDVPCASRHVASDSVRPVPDVI
jgi:hypothetical protein